MLQPIKLANAATLICVVAQILYIVVAAIVPGVVYKYISSMMPGYDLSLVETTEGVNYGSAFVGLIAMAVSIWVFVCLTILLYNRWTKQ
jgi:hypothetical protein